MVNDIIIRKLKWFMLLRCFKFLVFTFASRATSYNRMKLMFVGVEGIGKTSLLQLLRKEGKTKEQRYRVCLGLI